MGCGLVSCVLFCAVSVHLEDRRRLEGTERIRALYVSAAQVFSDGEDFAERCRSNKVERASIVVSEKGRKFLCFSACSRIFCVSRLGAIMCFSGSEGMQRLLCPAKEIVLFDSDGRKHQDPGAMRLWWNGE